MDHETVVAYLDRVGVTARAAGDAAGLRTLHRAHQSTVPFENLEREPTATSQTPEATRSRSRWSSAAGCWPSASTRPHSS